MIIPCSWRNERLQMKRLPLGAEVEGKRTQDVLHPIVEMSMTAGRDVRAGVGSP